MMNQTIKALIGSFIVYVSMAACSASEHTTIYINNDDDASDIVSVSDAADVPDIFSPVADAKADEPADSGSDTTSPPTQDGTRIRNRYYVGEDGSKQWQGLYDTQRNEECSFQNAEPGRYRCFPKTTGKIIPIWTHHGGCGQGGGQNSTPEYVYVESKLECASGKYAIAKPWNNQCSQERRVWTKGMPRAFEYDPVNNQNNWARYIDDWGQCSTFLMWNYATPDTVVLGGYAASVNIFYPGQDITNQFVEGNLN